MLIYSSIRWPTYEDKSLWPLAVSHDVYLQNHIPIMESGVGPIEIWTGSKQSHSYLSNSHPWGCPVYILDPKLQDGQKLPKWRTRSQVGKYVGF